MTAEEEAEIQQMRKVGVCWICRRTDVFLVRDHDHAVEMYATRALTCYGCNSDHMWGVDIGKYAIDPITRVLLAEPWYLKRIGSRIPYEPVVHVRVNDLDQADQGEVERLAHPHGLILNHVGMRMKKAKFGHPHVAELIAHNDYRAALRLVHLFKRGVYDTDIADMGEQRSTFQKTRLELVLKHAKPTPWDRRTQSRKRDTHQLAY